MNDVVILQVAMEASAMPPPASKANGSETDCADDASFDSVLEKAMKPEEDAETLALATEAVAVPVQTPVTQPVSDGNEVHVSEAEALVTSKMLSAMVEGQGEQVQPAIIAVVDAEAETPQPILGEQATSAAVSTPLETAAPVVIKDTSVAQAMPLSDNASTMQSATEMAIEIDYPRSSQTVSGAVSDTQQAQETQNTAPNTQNVEQSLPALEVPQDDLTIDSEGNAKVLVEVSKDNIEPSKPDTTEEANQPKSDAKATSEIGKLEIKTDAAKAPVLTEQAADTAVTSTSSAESQSTEANVQEVKTTAGTTISESRKVKANVSKLQGESPPQDGTAYGAIQSQELEAQVKEPARMAEARSPEIINQVTRGIDLLSRADGQSLRIQLHPENLGRIEIRLSSGSEGVTVTLNTDTQMTGNLLERSLSELRTSLADAGINLASLSVNSGQQEAAYQETSQSFSEKNTWKNYYKENSSGNEETPSVKTDWKESAIDYRV